jgi:osmoprotectant transport system permease protein
MLDWGWLADHAPALLYRTGQHLYLAAIAVAFGLAISFALGVIATRRRTLYLPFAVLTGLVYTIPSLALFAALVPIVGLSVLSAEIPLVLYTLVILFRNIVAGFDSVPPDVREAADAMSFADPARLLRVELPLAVPLIVAGIRIATVSTIGLVTITATLGDALGGLGFFIFEGARRGFATEIYAGAIPTILLALALDRLFVRVQGRLTPWDRSGSMAADERAIAMAPPVLPG